MSKTVEDRGVRILVFNRFYLPGYRAGGPIRTIANLVSRLGDQFEFFVVAFDRDSGDREPYPRASATRWHRLDAASVQYLDRENVSLGGLRSIIREVSPDVIYLNSFFDPSFTQRVLILKRIGVLGQIPVVLAPRGEFSPGALTIRRFKKLAYIWGSRFLGQYRNVTWQASSELEKVELLKAMPWIEESSVQIAMNLASLPTASLVSRQRSPSEPLRICFLSRISPKKNLDFALKVLSRVTCQATFSIYGPKEVLPYWDDCERLISSLPGNVEVRYFGELTPERIPQALSHHDLFFLPTKGENFGHVIFEALAAGLPILISDQTPWRDLVAKGVGWDLPLSDIDRFASVIEEVSRWSPAALEAARKSAIELASGMSSDSAVLQANRSLFASAMARRRT